METVKFLGISFRSAQHLLCFGMTIGALGLSIIAFVAGILTKRYEIPMFLYCFLGVLSLFISIIAVVKTKWGAFNGPIWSIDCFWYNGLLTIIYLGGATLCWHLAH